MSTARANKKNEVLNPSWRGSKLIEALMIQSCIKMAGVCVETQRNCEAGSPLTGDKMNIFFYCRNNKLSSAVKSIRAIPIIWTDAQIIVGCRRCSHTVFITSANCQNGRGAEIQSVIKGSVFHPFWILFWTSDWCPPPLTEAIKDWRKEQIYFHVTVGRWEVKTNWGGIDC